MRDRELNELWRIRFSKLLKCEREGFLFYRRFLKRNQKLLENTRAAVILDQISRDELKHFRIVRGLLRLLEIKKVRREKKGEKN